MSGFFVFPSHVMATPASKARTIIPIVIYRLEFLSTGIEASVFQEAISVEVNVIAVEEVAG